MLARLQRLLTLTAVGSGVIWTLVLVTQGQVVLGMLSALALISLHAAILAIEFLCMSRLNADDDAPKAKVREILAAWMAESVHAPRVFCWRQPFRSNLWPDWLPQSDRSRRGVLLVHGYVCNRGLWNGWFPRLQALGIPYVAINLEPVFGSIDDDSPRIENAVHRLQSSTGRPPVVVAHSMGGLVARRWWTTTETSRIHHLVTMGTPHHGTWLARWAHSANTRQMQLSSPWRKMLEAQESSDRLARITCFWSHCDNIVFPATKATLRGAVNRHLRGIAHVQMVDRPEPFDEVIRQVCQA